MTLTFKKPSSMIAGATYENVVLTVQIKDKSYVYEGVSEGLVQEWVEADSPGIFYNTRIKIQPSNNNAGGEVALPDLGGLLVFEAKKAYNTLIEKYGEPDGEDEAALEVCRASRKEAWKKATEYKNKRLEYTRQVDEIKKRLMEPEKELEALDADFKKWEEQYLVAKAKRQEEERKKAEGQVLLQTFGTKFKAHMDACIAVYEAELKATLTAKFNTAPEIPYEDLEAVYELPDWGTWGNDFAKPILAQFPDLKARLIEVNGEIKGPTIKGFSDRMRMFCADLKTQIPARQAQIASKIQVNVDKAIEAFEKEAEIKVQEIKTEAARTVAAEEMISMTAIPQSEEVPMEKSYEPTLREEWVRLLAVALQLPESETGLDKAWFDKNMGKVLTAMNKRLRAGEPTVVGVPVTTKVKISKR